MTLEPDAYEITAFKILMYLYENEDTGDSIDHVVKYWLQRRTEEYVTHKVYEVLEDLVAKGVIKKVGKKPIYKLNPGKQKEIFALIELLKPSEVS